MKNIVFSSHTLYCQKYWHPPLMKATVYLISLLRGASTFVHIMNAQVLQGEGDHFSETVHATVIYKYDHTL